jgi:hypothetical protein
MELKTKNSKLSTSPSTFHRPPFGFEQFSESVAMIALDLDSIFDGLAPGGAGALELGGELLEEGFVARQTLDNGHGLASPSGLLDP